MKCGYRDVAGIWMDWRELGAGTPVILVHGLATSHSLRRFVTPRIEHARC
ncbi:MAG: hypothetical protein M3329_07355 [Pseudomonadota bacterium]|nr:hypothetical protein [Pseudomonadota bacterium]